uniref:Aldehyde dehydrogenase domain-containing protein n=1 Tax=Skeletonema marinoi TaxID=267567 RepID=A0A7S2LDR8_9STRA
MTRSDSSSTSLLSSSKNNDSNSNEKTVPSPSLTYTPISSISPLITEARTSYATHFTHPYQFRLAQLDGIERLIRDNYSALSKTINLDLGQGSMYAEAFELTGMLGRISYAKSNLRQWMTTQSVPTPFPVNLNMPVQSQLTPYPRGVALIISPWNLPITLTLTPLLEAIAAGNVCVLKMSEKCVHTTSLLTELLSSGKYLDQRVVKVVNGEAEEATELLRHRFDVVSYTGGEMVGRIVNEATAKHLTPTLLELGGKNPVFVTKNADIACAAMRIAWGKVTGNAGQLCISPDYCLVEASVKEEFVEALCKAMDEFYPVSSYSGNNGDDGSRGDVGKMISVEHAERVVSMVDSTCNVIYGGKHHDTKERFVAPTIVEATADSTVMKDEIFGPILAIVTVPDLDSAIEYVQTNFSSKGKHPLNLYLFTKSKKEQQQIMNAIPSGTCAINDVIKHSANYYVPFGGIGTSGLGAYYGKFGFDFFSHYRGSLLVKNHSTSKLDPAVWMQFPPYNDKKIFAFRSLSKLPLIFGPLKRIAPVAKVLLPVALGGLLFWAGIMVERLKYFG